MGSTGFPPPFLTSTTSSFAEFAAQAAPHVLPARRLEGIVSADAAVTAGLAPHGTTIVALTYSGGVLMAGDRRATVGHTIASRTIEKVFPADSQSVIGIAGTAGLALELVRLFQLELEHYEKIEGTPLSLEGKANRLAAMLRSNLGLAIQGLAVVPLFAGIGDARPRIFSFDVTGGRYEEVEHHSVGSGSGFARGALKKLWRPDLGRTDAIRVAVEALYDAADDDSATGGPDLGRQIFPVVYTVEAAGQSRADDELVRRTALDVVAARAEGGRA